jgi:hypothetical protein
VPWVPQSYGQAWLLALDSAPVLLAVTFIVGWGVRWNGWRWQACILIDAAAFLLSGGLVQSHSLHRRRKKTRSHVTAP